MQVDFVVALMSTHIFLHGCAGMSGIGYWTTSGYNLDDTNILRLTGRIAVDIAALVRRMPMRPRHVFVRDTSVSCRETSMMLLFTKVMSCFALVDSSCVKVFNFRTILALSTVGTTNLRG